MCWIKPAKNFTPYRVKPFCSNAVVQPRSGHSSFWCFSLGFIRFQGFGGQLWAGRKEHFVESQARTGGLRTSSSGNSSPPVAGQKNANGRRHKKKRKRPSGQKKNRKRDKKTDNRDKKTTSGHNGKGHSGQRQLHRGQNQKQFFVCSVLCVFQLFSLFFFSFLFLLPFFGLRLLQIVF